MSTELEAFLIALAIATVPNLLIKWIETRQPKENLGKTTLEAADISFDMLKETIESQKESINFYQERLDFKRQELEKVEKENEILHLEVDRLQEEIKNLKKENN